MWQDALRVCKEYIPHKLQALQDEYEREMIGNSKKWALTFRILNKSLIIYECAYISGLLCVIQGSGSVGSAGPRVGVEWRVPACRRVLC